MNSWLPPEWFLDMGYIPLMFLFENQLTDLELEIRELD